MSTEGSPFSKSRRSLDVDVPSERAGEVAAALGAAVGQSFSHPAFLQLADAGVSGGRAFVDFEMAGGQPLDAALREYGPADIADGIPRVRRIADVLDAAAARGLCHGALAPADVIISPDDTRLIGIGVVQVLARAGLTLRAPAPYDAPERADGMAASPAADQFALAAITFEWLFGRQIDGPSDEGIAVPSLSGAHRERLAVVFSRALSRDPRHRYERCAAFVDALEGRAPVVTVPPPPALDDLPIYPGVPGELPLVAAADDEPASGAAVPIALPPAAAAAAHWRVGVVAAVLVVAVAIGAALSWRFAGRWQPPAPEVAEERAQPFTEAAVSPSTPPATPPSSRAPAAVAEELLVEPPIVPSPDEARPALVSAPAPDAARAAQLDAGLLVHSVPAGAMVSVDGVPRGTTPVAVRGLTLGTRTVVVTRPGYRATSRQVTLTSDRPSRALELSLVPAAPPASAPAAVREGALVVDSRPAGATVIINGRPAGVTPLTLTGVAAGAHAVRIERAGYRAVATTVDVVAGQRARVAVRLEGGQEEE